jgi:hypothetical protein
MSSTVPGPAHPAVGPVPQVPLLSPAQIAFFKREGNLSHV